MYRKFIGGLERCRHFILLLGILASSFLQATELPRLRHFNPRDFGGQNQSWDFSQGRDGQVFVANSGGIFQFDGSRWIERQLPGQPIVRTVHCQDGILYAGGFGEFGYWENLGGVNEQYISLSDQLAGKGKFTEEIWHIAALSNGKIVFQSFAQLFYFDGERIEQVPSPGLLMFSFPVEDELYIPNTGRGVGVWKAGHSFSLIEGTERVLNEQITGIAGDEQNLLFATALNGIYRLEGNRISKLSIPAEVARAQINRLLKLTSGRLAVGTILDGLFILSADGKRIEHHLNRRNGLQNNTVLALYEDRAKDLWIGLDTGIDLLVLSEPARFFTAQQQALGAVYSALQNEGQFYLGTNQGLYIKPMNDTESSFRLVSDTPGQVWSLTEAKSNVLCGHNEGTFELSGTQANLISEFSGGWQTTECPWAENVYIQATYTGLIWLENENEQWTAERIPEFIAPIKYIDWLSSWKLFATHGSRGAYVIQIDPEKRRISHIDTLEQTDISQGQIINLDSAILVQNAKGQIFEFDSSQYEFSPVDKWNGVDIEPEAFILPGRKKKAEWFIVEPDILSMYRGTELIVSLPIRARIPQPAIIPWHDNSYLVGLDDGYATISPEQNTSTLPSVKLKLFTRAADNTWQAIADYSDLDIPFAKNQIRFQFNQAIFDRPTEFKYRLLGLNEGWSDWSDRSSKEYASLAVGDYTFELRNKWTNQLSSIEFSVQPPWYKTLWAYLSYLALFLMAGRFALLWHEKRLSRQARAFEVKRQRELQRQRILARNNQLSLENKRKSKELANSTLALARRNELLLQLKEQIQHAYKSANTDTDKNRIHKIRRSIEKELESGDDWAIFESHFEEVHEAFLTRLRKIHPKLTAGDLKLAAYLRMNLSSKEIAPLLHISIRGIENKRYRLRTKLELDSGVNLNDYLAKF
ncbi:MAG: two-component regulator propeller domain-containing protein [Bacteroidota bacterium]